eukprot:gene8236-8320_t
MTDMNRNFIAGDWVTGANTTLNINPSDTSDVIGAYAQADETQTLVAIEAAKQAFKHWSVSTPQQRFDALNKISAEILARKEELGHLLSREEGKTLPEGIGEVTRAGQIFAFFAGEALRLSGDKLASVRPAVDVEGTFNLVMGRGSVVGQTLLNHRDVTAITFTGSVSTGNKVALACINRMAKFQLEMGGKNPLVILDDADLKTAVEVAVNGSYFSTGQRCTASSRIIVTEGIHDQFVAAVAARLKGLTIDNALKAGTHIGPVVDQNQLDQDQSYINIGRNEGAKLVTGGELLNRETAGFYMAPALFTEVSNTMRIAREEIFGPVAAVIRVKNYEEALHMANDTDFGLASGICTSSLKHATHFKRHAEAGMVMVNLPTAGVDYHVPFGGRKGSSYGSREQGKYAAEFFTTVKTAYTFAG